MRVGVVVSVAVSDRVPEVFSIPENDPIPFVNGDAPGKLAFASSLLNLMVPPYAVAILSNRSNAVAVNRCEVPATVGDANPAT